MLISARILSVMSSPMLAVPITSPLVERSIEMFHRISRRSPERVTISFSRCHEGGGSLRDAVKTSRKPRRFGGTNSSNQSRPMISLLCHPVSLRKKSLQ
jgi:hypothetical protein